MSNLHFIQYDKSWYYRFDNNKDDKVYVGDNLPASWLWFSDTTSKVIAQNILKEKFPNENIIYTTTYSKGKETSWRDKKKFAERRYQEHRAQALAEQEDRDRVWDSDDEDDYESESENY